MTSKRVIQEVLDRLSEKGYKGRIVPVNRAESLRSGIEEPYKQNLIDKELYKTYFSDFKYSPSEQLPAAGSIILIAFPRPQVRVVFNWKGKCFSSIVPPNYSEVDNDRFIKKVVESVLEPKGYRVVHTRLPKKLLAVHSGLAKYGRNNLTYVPGMGSFYHLAAYYSDLPCEEDAWYDLQVMERCKKCRACQRACPPKAIPADRFLLRAEQCIANHNEKPSKIPFPEWFDLSWHNSVVGCMLCQVSCPENKEVISFTRQGAEFTEEETKLLLQEVPLKQLPAATVDKLQESVMLNYLDLLPRNLRVLINQQVDL